MKQRTKAPCNYEYHKWNVEQNNPDTKGDIVYDFIYIKLKTGKTK